jgi:hypothetical protein
MNAYSSFVGQFVGNADLLGAEFLCEQPVRVSAKSMKRGGTHSIL